MDFGEVDIPTILKWLLQVNENLTTTYYKHHGEHLDGAVGQLSLVHDEEFKFTDVRHYYYELA
jgi:hypothetical protein